MRNPIDIWRETTPADVLDAMASVLGETGAPRSVNDLEFIGGGMFFGRAVTMRSLPARADSMTRSNEVAQEKFGMSIYSRALSLLDEKSVFVIESRSTEHFATAGGTGLTAAFARKTAAIVTDGVLRDRQHLTNLSETHRSKVAAAGFTAQYGTARMLYPADVNIPIAIKNMLVLPGDFVFGNADAVVVIPEDPAEEILELGVVNTKLAEAMEHIIIETKGIAGATVTTETSEVKAYIQSRFLSLDDKQS